MWYDSIVVFGHYLGYYFGTTCIRSYLTHQGGGGGVAASSGATSSWHSANDNRFIICGFGFDDSDGFRQKLAQHLMSLMSQMMDQRDLKGVTALV